MSLPCARFISGWSHVKTWGTIFMRRTSTKVSAVQSLLIACVQGRKVIAGCYVFNLPMCKVRTWCYPFKMPLCKVLFPLKCPYARRHPFKMPICKVLSDPFKMSICKVLCL